MSLLSTWGVRATSSWPPCRQYGNGSDLASVSGTYPRPSLYLRHTNHRGSPARKGNDSFPLDGLTGQHPACDQADAGPMDTETEQTSQQPAAPPDVYLIGEAGFTPVFPKVGGTVTYYWSEANRGGQHPDTYHARVLWKVD